MKTKLLILTVSLLVSLLAYSIAVAQPATLEIVPDSVTFAVIAYPENGVPSPGQYALTPIFQGITYIVEQSGEVSHIKVVTDALVVDFRPTGDPGNPYGYFIIGGRFQFTDRLFRDTFSVGPNDFNTDFHDIIIRPDSYIFGDYGADDTGGLWDFKLVEVDRAGDTLWSWRAMDYISPTNSIPDWHHWNSAVLIDNDTTIVLSFRHVSSIFGIAYPEGFVRWQFGGKRSGNHPMFSLAQGQFPCAQHDVKVYSFTLTVFDNGNGCRDYSRGVEYQMDFKNFVATQTLVISSPYIAGAMGSYERLPDGNRLIGWGGMNTESSPQPQVALAEYNSLGQPIIEILWDRPAFISYRARKLTPLEVLYMPIVFKDRLE